MNRGDARYLLKHLFEEALDRGNVLEHILLFRTSQFDPNDPHYTSVFARQSFSTIIPHLKWVDSTRRSAIGLDRAGDVAAYITGLQLQQGDILFLEDIHLLPEPCSAFLSELMDNYAIRIKIGKPPNNKELSLPLAQFTIIGATDRPHLLTQQLRKSFKRQILIDETQ